MVNVLANSVWSIINPWWLTGPILDKELRVSSRRKRNYALRSCYLLLLMVFIILTWFNAVMSVRVAGTSIYGVSRMAFVGRTVTHSIIWFQFVTAQIVAAVMLSNSISEEINRGSLYVLMATPINSLQIVVGKILSKLLQLFLLMAVSVSILIVVRVMGGIEWDYVLSGFCITMTAVLLAASLSMFLSIGARRAYTVILAMIILLVVFYVVGSLSRLLGGFALPIRTAIYLTNPMAALLQASAGTIPGLATTALGVSWPMHCLCVFVMSIGIISASVFRLRRSALINIAGDRKESGFSWLSWITGLGTSRRKNRYRPIKAVTGAPVLWKEMDKDSKIKSMFINPASIAALLYFVSMFFMVMLGNSGTGLVYRSVFSACSTGLWLIVNIRIAAMSAISIAREKESRTWPLLLGTGLTDWQILSQKAKAVLLKNLVAWLILIIGYILFMFLQLFLYFNPGSTSAFFSNLFIIVIMVFLITCKIMFMIGAGFYFSSRLRSSAAAVVATVGTAIAFQFLVPRIMQLIFPLLARWGSLLLILYYSIQIGLYACLGPFLLWRAKCNMRKNIF